MLDREWIQERRRYLGLTRQYVAEMVGVSECTVRNLELGRAPVERSLAARKIVEALEKASEGWLDLDKDTPSPCWAFMPDPPKISFPFSGLLWGSPWGL
jgi:transcriptional regulator with XRE-family HTH domain